MTDLDPKTAVSFSLPVLKCFLHSLLVLKVQDVLDIICFPAERPIASKCFFFTPAALWLIQQPRQQLCLLHENEVAFAYILKGYRLSVFPFPCFPLFISCQPGNHWEDI
ncbi:unnamed protein product [Rangifer tarandus platyrhynchus]|uniref:Uncharacterized protein n=1 Tax=Rangifer tarandus platyrhynchus TaxID=3082113 RepID=A0AC59ZZF8_RANTA